MKLQSNTFMAMNGAAAGILGSADSGSDAIEQLKRAVVEFVGQSKAGADLARLKQSYRAVLAKIMVAQTMGSIGEELADELVATLQQIMKEGQ